MSYEMPTAEEYTERAKSIYAKFYAKDIDPPLWILVYILLDREHFPYLDQKRVAQILGISQGTVSKQYAKAKKILKNQGLLVKE